MLVFERRFASSSPDAIGFVDAVARSRPRPATTIRTSRSASPLVRLEALHARRGRAPRRSTSTSRGRSRGSERSASSRRRLSRACTPRSRATSGAASLFIRCLLPDLDRDRRPRWAHLRRVQPAGARRRQYPGTTGPPYATMVHYSPAGPIIGGMVICGDRREPRRRLRDDVGREARPAGLGRPAGRPGALHQQIHDDLVESLAIGEGIPKPEVYVIDDPSPNAFATGGEPQQGRDHLHDRAPPDHEPRRARGRHRPRDEPHQEPRHPPALLVVTHAHREPGRACWPRSCGAARSRRMGRRPGPRRNMGVVLLIALGGLLAIVRLHLRAR